MGKAKKRAGPKTNASQSLLWMSNHSFQRDKKKIMATILAGRLLSELHLVTSRQSSSRYENLFQ